MTVISRVRPLVLIAALAAFSPASLAAGDGDTKGTIILSVEQGKEWNHSFRVMLVGKITNQPQMAFWLEDTAGAYVATIYATHRTAVQDWRAGFGEKRERIKRPSSLPVWVRAHAEGGVEPKSLCASCHRLHKQRAKDVSDLGLHAITGATPKTGFSREWILCPGIKPGRYVVRAEINHSKDFNDAYPAGAKEGEAGWSGGSMGSGQPSLVYEGMIDIGGAAASATLVAIGHGEPAGASGALSGDLCAFTTALEIVKAIRVDFEPGE